MVNTKSVVAGLSLVLLCWLGLYAHKEKWDNLDFRSVSTSEKRQVEVRVERAASALTGSRKLFQELSPDDRKFLKGFGVKKLKETFKPIFSPREKKQVMEALRQLTDSLHQAGIDYFLYGGSLIGSWRHHDIVPWDDDLDIIVNISSMEALEKIKVPGYTLNIQTLNRYKFYSDNATDIPGYFWKWPYIDICFFGDNGTHLYDMDPTFSKIFVYNKKDVLPLVRRPFGSLNLKVPHNTEKVLQQNYNVNNCKTRSYNHQTQVSLGRKNVKTVDCALLYRVYPFVFRDTDYESSGRKHVENIYLNGRLLKTVDLS